MFCVVSRYVKSSLAVVVVEFQSKSSVAFRVVALLFLGILSLAYQVCQPKLLLILSLVIVKGLETSLIVTKKLVYFCVNFCIFVTLRNSLVLRQ